MKKVLLLFIALILCAAPAALAEKLRVDTSKFISGGRDAYTPYLQYFSEYTERLSSAFQPKGKFPWRTFIFTTVQYLIHKDGSLSNFEIIDSSTENYEYYISKYNPIGRYRARKASPKMDKYVTEIIKNNPPKPFLEGMDCETIRVEVQTGYFKRSDEVSYMVNTAGCYVPSNNTYVLPKFTIYLCHDSRKIFK